jgi:ankyrin repeat protein
MLNARSLFFSAITLSAYLLVFHAGAMEPDALSYEDPNKRLLQASEAGDKTSVESALAAGANVNHRSKQGYTALSLAVCWGWADIVRLLIDQGADVNAPGWENLTPLGMLTQTQVRPTTGRILRDLLDHKAVLDSHQASAFYDRAAVLNQMLMLVAGEGAHEHVELFIREGATRGEEARNIIRERKAGCRTNTLQTGHNHNRTEPGLTERVTQIEARLARLEELVVPLLDALNARFGSNFLTQ